MGEEGLYAVDEVLKNSVDVVSPSGSPRKIQEAVSAV